MTEIVIHGRGGQGGVTLAKLIAAVYFRAGCQVQAFGLYAAERSGAPVQAFVRIDDREITTHNQIRAPDHVIVLDPILASPAVASEQKPGGWIIINTRASPDSYLEMFSGRNVAVIDATGLAVRHGLGTQAVPIVNTTMFGAVARVLDLSIEDVKSALDDAHLSGGNFEAAQQAFEQVWMAALPGNRVAPMDIPTRCKPAGLLDEDIGGLPRIKTGSWATRQPERNRLEPPCNHVCPAGNDVQGFIAALTDGGNDAALEILLRTTPFPGVCGRVCPAPCMDSCNRRLFDEAVNVRELERFAADHGRRPPALKPHRAESVAVIGSGPAGLSAAYTLARLGYRVTIHEAYRELGGLLRTGIPEYRLPRDVLDGDIQYILQHDVKVRAGKGVKRADLVRLTRRHEAVLVATGLQESRSLDFDGGDRGIVMQGLDFLDRARSHSESLENLVVVVIGGGNTAVDSARSARRLGAQRVHIVYRRTREEMPAIEEEINEALEEGIVLDELTAPVRLQRNGARALLTCQRMRLGEPDESGRPRPIPETTEDAQFDLPCDRVILALGQSADMSLLPSGSEVSEEGVVLGRTEAPIYVCGDFATNEGTVAAAIGSGRRAAWIIHRALTGEDLSPSVSPVVATPDVIRDRLFTPQPRERGEVLPASIRRRGFEEVRRGLVDGPNHHSAVHEANRCFSCGVCNFCDRCVVHCPEGIMVRNGDGYRFDESYCKGCGVCAEECPRGVIRMFNI